MPVSLTYPGVYLEEIPSGVRTIMGVSTSVTAFVGYTKRGPLNKAQEVLSFADFERKFGGLSKDSSLSYAVQHFFLNGGERAVIVRVTAEGTASKAEIMLKGLPNQGQIPPAYEPVLKVVAKEPGEWANALSIIVDYETAHPESTFNLSVLDRASRKSESYIGLSMNADSKRSAESVINSASKLINVTIRKDAFGKIADPEKRKGKSISRSAVDPSKLDKDHRKFMITLREDDGPKSIEIYDGLDANKPGDLKALRDCIVNKVKASSGADAYSKFACPDTGNLLTLVSGDEGPGSFVRITSADSLDAARTLGLGVINGGREIDAAGYIRPAPNGSISGSLDGLDFASLFKDNRSIKVTIDGDSQSIILFNKVDDTSPKGPNELALLLQRKIRAIKPTVAGSTSFMGTSCKALGKSIQITSGSDDPNSVIKIENNGADTSADDLLLSEGKTAIHNVKSYTLGTGEALAGQGDAAAGKDGLPPEPKDYVRSEEKKTGIYALQDVDIFNLLCLPEVDGVSPEGIDALIKAAAFCKQNRAILIADCPKSWKTFDNANDNLLTYDPLRSENVVLYFPWVMMSDPLSENRLREFPPCGVVAGIFARTDSTRGVWKAPAGQDATLTGVNSLVYRLTDRENGLLNPLGLNCLRTFPIVGSVVWGARTLRGADVLTSEWKYIPIRRTALYIEESLFRALKWVVFEPNDEPLWAQIRLNVGAFMHDLFRKGAFQGGSPREAYFVKCDKDTTTQTDRDKGIVNILVGFAPLKPAEFVVIKIQQIAGQIET
ncbi:MAG: phage tail protein [Methanosarcinales archaeon]|nr:phage tail protein [Methanosarcinales archaeon]